MTQQQMPAFTVEPLAQAELDSFFAYLNDHLGDNGSEGAGYFQPLPSKASRVPMDKEKAFRGGLAVALGTAGWRRAWVARGLHGRILGHVDLRARAEDFTAHRCLLGMGVDRDHRRLGIGMSLLTQACRWAASTPMLQWIDLQVLSANERAMRLYLQAGFVKTGETPEMFELDGTLWSYTSMSKRIAMSEPQGAMAELQPAA